MGKKDLKFSRIDPETNYFGKGENQGGHRAQKLHVPSIIGEKFSRKISSISGIILWKIPGKRIISEETESYWIFYGKIHVEWS